MSTSSAPRSARASKKSKNDIEHRVRQAVAAAEGRQAADLRVLGLGKVSDFTDYFVVCSGASERQVLAIADAVEETLREAGVRSLHVEGRRGGNWVLLDYGAFVVHVFQEETRRFYALERLWSDAPEVTSTFGKEMRRSSRQG
jgi:ribosome-associated protein